MTRTETHFTAPGKARWQTTASTGDPPDLVAPHQISTLRTSTTNCACLGAIGRVLRIQPYTDPVVPTTWPPTPRTPSSTRSPGHWVVLAPTEHRHTECPAVTAASMAVATLVRRVMVVPSTTAAAPPGLAPGTGPVPLGQARADVAELQPPVAPPHHPPGMHQPMQTHPGSAPTNVTCSSDDPSCGRCWQRSSPAWDCPAAPGPDAGPSA